MTKQIFMAFIVSVSAVLFYSSTAFAQQAVISPEKLALINELRDLSTTSKFSINIDTKETKFEDPYAAKADKDTTLSEEQKKAIRDAAIETKAKIDKAFADFSDPSSVSRLFEEFSIKMYDESFSENELTETINFFKTPAGQKVAKFMLYFIDNLNKNFGKFYDQKAKDFLTKKVIEESKILKKRIEEIRNGKLEA